AGRGLRVPPGRRPVAPGRGPPRDAPPLSPPARGPGRGHGRACVASGSAAGDGRDRHPDRALPLPGAAGQPPLRGRHHAPRLVAPPPAPPSPLLRAPPPPARGPGAPRLHLAAWIAVVLFVLLLRPLAFRLQFAAGLGAPLLALGALRLARFPPPATLLAAAL